MRTNRALLQSGQFEIMGLAIIVVLVTLGVLFALSTLTAPETSLQQTFEQKRLAVDFLKASLDTQAPPCAKASLRELFQDCTQSRTIRCLTETNAEINSCVFLKKTYASLFDQTLERFNQRYYFEVTGPCEGSRELCDITQGTVAASGPAQPCPGEREISSQPLPTRVGTITLTLQICG